VSLGTVELGTFRSRYDDLRQTSDEDATAWLAASRDRALATRTTEIATDGVALMADLTIPRRPIGWVVFVHGSGSTRLSSRNVAVATVLNEAGVATLLFDLLTRAEELDRRNVFDIELLTRRLTAATRWLAARPEARDLPIGYFGASTGAAAALCAAAERGDAISAVVSRGGRPDLAGDQLAEVRAPTLLIVGSADTAVLELNRAALVRLTCTRELAIVPGATHLFEEPGALEQVASLATSWFTAQLNLGRERHAEEGGLGGL
jgi:putative phosphoribosyl transferase